MSSAVALFTDLLAAYNAIGTALIIVLHCFFHRQRWAVVMEELISTTSCMDDDTDGGYDSPPPLEDWNDICDEDAAFLDHRRMWAGC
ncbi:hypothetical protein LSAT2_013958 [Lamellibrachia satsuma]|nr:hypothetical protein LSAT2_013958 [Lamellibrachia satsuma]